MKRFFLLFTLAFMALFSVSAQSGTGIFMKIDEHDMFSQCFASCDANKDGIVTFDEAAATTKLSLERGGRLNIIEDYEFLKHFPNLEAISVGNTTLEVIDMHYLTKIKTVDVSNALWLKKIIVAPGIMAPEITGEPHDDPLREVVKVEFYVADPVARGLFAEGYEYVEPVEQNGEKIYIVGVEYAIGPFGLWRNGKLEVPCEYNIDFIKENYFTVQTVDGFLNFADEGFKAFCLRNKKIDTDKDGNITKEEAEAVTKLSLMSTRSFIVNIKSYEDLKYFPNLESFDAGFNYLETIDVSCCPKLKQLDLSDSRMLKTVVLAKDCKPEIRYPVAYKGEAPKIVYSK